MTAPNYRRFTLWILDRAVREAGGDLPPVVIPRSIGRFNFRVRAAFESAKARGEVWQVQGFYAGRREAEREFDLRPFGLVI